MRFTEVVGKGKIGPMIEANRDARIEEDCGCPDGAEEQCINILCPRK